MNESQVITPVRKQRHSRKAPTVKAQVVIQRASGLSKSKIAQELGITRPTVNAILEESNIDRMLEDGRLQGAKLIPESLRVMRNRLAKDSESAATFVLSKTIWNPDNEIRKASTIAANMHLQQAISILVAPANAENKELSAVVTQGELANAEVNDAQVVENKC